MSKTRRYPEPGQLEDDSITRRNLARSGDLQSESDGPDARRSLRHSSSFTHDRDRERDRDGNRITSRREEHRDHIDRHREHERDRNRRDDGGVGNVRADDRQGPRESSARRGPGVREENRRRDRRERDEASEATSSGLSHDHESRFHQPSSFGIMNSASSTSATAAAAAAAAVSPPPPPPPSLSQSQPQFPATSSDSADESRRRGPVWGEHRDRERDRERERAQGWDRDRDRDREARMRDREYHDGHRKRGRLNGEDGAQIGRTSGRAESESKRTRRAL